MKDKKKSRFLLILFIAASILYMFTVISFCDTEDASSNTGDSFLVSTEFADYEVDSENNATLVRLHDITDDFFDVPGIIEVEGQEYMVTGIAAGILSELPDVKTLWLPDTVKHIDDAFLAGTNVATTNIPAGAEGHWLLEGSYVSQLYIEDRDEISKDLLYEPLQVYEEWRFVDTDYWRYDTSGDEIFDNEINGIGRWALEKVVLDGYVGEIEEDAFACCERLEYVIDGQNIGKIGKYAFAYCEALQWLQLSVTKIEEGTFLHCGSLHAIDFELEEGAELTIGDGAFMVCLSLEDFPQNVGSIGEYSFAVANFTNDITIPDIDIPYRAFWNCSAPSITMETDEFVQNVTICEEAFMKCRTSNISLSGNVHTIGADAFAYSYLETIDLDNVSSIGDDAFRGCSKLTGTVRIPAVAMGTNVYQDCSKITGAEFYFPDGKACAYDIKDYMFSGCKALTTVTIPEGLGSIGYAAFRYSGIERLVLPSSVASIGEEAFSNCTALTSAEIPSCSQMGKAAFRGCSALTNAVLPETMSSMGQEAFSGCKKLAKVSLPSVETIPVKAFYQCQKLKAAIVPEGVKYISEDAFCDCIYMETVELPDSLVRIGDRAFAICQYLENLDLGNGVKYIGTSAFEYCDMALNRVTIPCSVEEIGPFAFMTCLCLHEFYMSEPTGQRTIGGGFLHGTKVGNFTLYKNDTFTFNKHSDITAGNSIYTTGPIYSNAGLECGALTGAEITSIVVNDDVAAIPDYFFYNKELVEHTLNVNIMASGLRIGTKAFYNSTKVGPVVDFYAGAPSYIAQDAFGVDEGTDPLTAQVAYRYEPEKWESFIHSNYGREIVWRYIPPPELTWDLSDDGVLTISSENGAATMPDYDLYSAAEASDPDGGDPGYDPYEDPSVNAPPWAKALLEAKKIVITGNVLNIGSHAFIGGQYVNEVKIDSSLRSIHSEAFYGFSGSLRIYISGSMPNFSQTAFASGCGKDVHVFYPDSDDHTWDPVRTIAAARGEDVLKYYGAEKAYWIESTLFDIYRDNNSISNNYRPGQFEDYNTKFINDLTRTVKPNEALDIDIFLLTPIDTNTYGVCWGFASTMMLQVMHQHSPFPEGPYYKIDPSSGDYTDIVKYYQLVQKAPTTYSPTATVSKDWRGNYDEDDLQALLRKVVTMASYENAFCLDYGYGDEAHIGVVCGLEYGDLHHEPGKEYAVRIYDCNNFDKYFYMYIDDDFEWFSYQDSNMEKNHVFLEYRWTDLSIYTCSDLAGLEVPILAHGNSPGFLKSIVSRIFTGKSDSTGDGTADPDHIYITVPAFKSFEMTNAEGKKLIVGEDSDASDLTVYNKTTHTSEDGVHSTYLEIDPSDRFEITNIDGEYKFITEVGGKVCYAETNNASSIIISKDNGIEVSGDGLKDYSLAIRDQDKDNALTLVSGKVDGDITMSMQEENISVHTSGEIKSIAITTDATGEVVKKELTEEDLGSGCSGVSFDPGNEDGITPDIEKDGTDPSGGDNNEPDADPCKSGHKFSSWKTTTAATELAAGKQTRKCSVCGKTETRALKKLAPTLPSVKISKIEAAKKAATIKWKKISKKNQKKISSIQIQYSRDKTFKTGVKTVTAKRSATSKKIKKLTSKKTYYVRIRTYKKDAKGVHISKWSAVKKVKAR